MFSTRTLPEDDSGAKQQHEALPAFCTGMVAAGWAARYNKDVPRETTGNKKKENTSRPERRAGPSEGDIYYEKDHSSFVPVHLRRCCRCCCTTNSQERTTRDLFHNIFLQIGPGSRPAAIYVVFVFFLGMALLYSSGSISSTMAGQNAGKSLGGRARLLQGVCKLTVKTVAPFFTLPEKLPKTTLLPLGRTTKSPGHSFQSARGKGFFISSWV